MHRSWGWQNILEINKGKSPLEIHRGREQMWQHDQDNGREPGLAGYVMWKSDTKSAAWVSSVTGIHSDSSPVSSYPNQITLYRSLHACRRSILESTIREISYSGSLSIMTGAGPAVFSRRKCLMWWVQAWTHGRLDGQSAWILEDGEWMIECQAERWFRRVQDIFRRVSLKARWFRRTEPWQRLCHLL